MNKKNLLYSTLVLFLVSTSIFIRSRFVDPTFEQQIKSLYPKSSIVKTVTVDEIARLLTTVALHQSWDFLDLKDKDHWISEGLRDVRNFQVFRTGLGMINSMRYAKEMNKKSNGNLGDLYPCLSFNPRNNYHDRKYKGKIIVPIVSDFLLSRTARVLEKKCNIDGLLKRIGLTSKKRKEYIKGALCFGFTATCKHFLFNHFLPENRRWLVNHPGWIDRDQIES